MNLRIQSEFSLQLQAEFFRQVFNRANITFGGELDLQVVFFVLLATQELR